MLNKNAKPIWLASYPKSGNTWTRLFLSALLKEKDPDLNDLGTDGIISARHVIDTTLGMNSADLPENDYLIYRSQLYHKWASSFPNREYLLCKVHDACTLEGEVLFPTAITRGVVYILRNPFDMAASTANHSGVSIDKAVKMLCSNKHALAKKRTNLNSQISQHLGTWSNHVESWTNVHRSNLLLIRYEDMLNDGFDTFSKVVNYIGLNYSAEAIQNAIEKTSFKNVQEKEQSGKFLEAPKAAERFFRSGKVGGWKNEISQEQADLIIDCNYEALLKYGYIDAAGTILV